MSYRASDANSGRNPTERILISMAKRLESLARRVRRIEESNRGLPGEFRFEMEKDDDGAYLVVLRVGGGRERISGPL